MGSSNRRADKELIAELKRFASGASYDEEPLPDLDSEAIDFRAASESFASKRRLKRADLDTLRIETKHQGHVVPTVGGMLLFGHERERYFPDAWIQDETDRAIIAVLSSGEGQTTAELARGLALRRGPPAAVY